MATIGVEKRRLSLKRSKGSDFKQAKENKMESNGVEDTLPYCRLVNLGNTCYINVIIQCMKFTPGFIELIDRTVKNEQSVHESVHEFIKLLHLMETVETSNQNKVIDPTKFIRKFQSDNVQFENGLQHDSLECLNVLLNKFQLVTTNKRISSTEGVTHQRVSGRITDYFHTSVNSHVFHVKATPTSHISDLFEGQLVYGTTCLTCDTVQCRYEKFTYISVPVTSTTSQYCGAYSLHWSLSQFAAVEYLRYHNKYFCQNCQHLTEARHNILINKLPNIVILHLNRFSMQFSITKAARNIGIPKYLSFDEWCTTNCINKRKVYQLYSVILHTGSSCTSGHYTVLIKRSNDEWILFNDDNLHILTYQQFNDIISPLSVSLCTPYILFYSVLKT